MKPVGSSFRPLGRAILALLAVLLLAAADQPARMQYRTFLRGNLQARGPIQPNGAARFVSLLIGEPRRPLDAGTSFFIRLGNGQVLESGDFNVERISALAGMRKLILERSEWGQGAVEYSFEGMVFVFKKERCVAFRANWVQLPNRVFAPEIGSPISNAFFKMPLTQGQLEAVFGPAEEIRDKTTL